MSSSNLPIGYVRLKYISSDLRGISDEYVVHISTHTIGRLGLGLGDVVDAVQPFQFQFQFPSGTLFFEFDTATSKMAIRASTVYSLIVERLGDVLMCAKR